MTNLTTTITSSRSWTSKTAFLFLVIVAALQLGGCWNAIDGALADMIEKSLS